MLHGKESTTTSRNLEWSEGLLKVMTEVTKARGTGLATKLRLSHTWAEICERSPYFYSKNFPKCCPTIKSYVTIVL